MSRILIVDDSPTVIAAVRAFLSADGHVVETLESFVELPRLLRRTPPDLVMLDLNMPTMDGLSFGRFIRKHQQYPIPIVIYSGATNERIETAKRELGATYIAKNRPPGELRKLIAEMLRHQPAMRAGTLTGVS